MGCSSQYRLPACVGLCQRPAPGNGNRRPQRFRPGANHQAPGCPSHASAHEGVYGRLTRTRILCLLLHGPGKDVSKQGRVPGVGEADRFLTPMAKAYATEKGFRVTQTAMQVYGGYGYMKDYIVEQFLRDAKFITIGEGTTGIQALDLVGRKLVQESEALLKGHLEDISKFCKESKNHRTLAHEIDILETAKEALSDVSMALVKIHKENFRVLALYATPYLELFGDVTVGWLLMWQAVIAEGRLTALAKEKGSRRTGG